MKSFFLKAAMAGTLAAGLTACFTDSHDHGGDHDHVHSLFVAHAGTLNAWNIETGEQRAGEMINVNGATDLQALKDGTLLVNLGATHEVLVVDGESMIETRRIPSSTRGGKKPVHSYISPTYSDTSTYWMTLNDSSDAGTAQTALFIDLKPTSANYLKAMGEVALGVGHHKASFSKTKKRVIISNISDAAKVVAVYDFTDPANIVEVKGFSAADLGILGFAAPHGCGTAALNGHGYCNATGTGDIISVDLDAAVPTFKLLKTNGSGGGYTKAHPAGRYVYSLQTSPREGDTVRVGTPCQVGQIAVIDAQSDSVIKQVPLKYGASNCADAVVGTTAATAGPGHIVISGTTMYVQMASGFTDPTGYASKHLVLDITDPANPSQTAAPEIGKSRSHHGECLSGDDAYFFVANNLDGTISQFDAATGTVTKTLTVKSGPSTCATWHPHEGPSHQTGPF